MTTLTIKLINPRWLAQQEANLTCMAPGEKRAALQREVEEAEAHIEVAAVVQAVAREKHAVVKSRYNNGWIQKNEAGQWVEFGTWQDVVNLVADHDAVVESAREWGLLPDEQESGDAEEREITVELVAYGQVKETATLPASEAKALLESPMEKGWRWRVVPPSHAEPDVAGEERRYRLDCEAVGVDWRPVLDPAGPA